MLIICVADIPRLAAPYFRNRGPNWWHGLIRYIRFREDFDVESKTPVELDANSVAVRRSRHFEKQMMSANLKSKVVSMTVSKPVPVICKVVTHTPKKSLCLGL